jgi:glycosyltransferase involved in cell wall biosynthesis
VKCNHVTAIIPLHNHEQWIWGAIESVANQGYPEKSIVVVDDGSTDGSKNEVFRHLYKPKQGKADGLVGSPDIIIGTIPNNGTELVLISYKEGHGPAFARNRGIEAAPEKTVYFALLDSDDLYEPGKITKSVEAIEKAPEIFGGAYSDYDTLRPDGLRVREFKLPYSREELLKSCIVNCDSIISKKAFEEVGLFDESLRVAEDFDLWLRISEHFLFYHLPESLVTIRVGDHSSTSTVSPEVWNACHKKVIDGVNARSKYQLAPLTDKSRRL